MHLGSPAQVIGQVTFSLSYVVVIVRARLAVIGGEYQEAARDLGATPIQALRLVLLPLLMPAILASMLIVFALSIDDFVVTQYMSSTRRRPQSRCTCMPMPRWHDHTGAQRPGDRARGDDVARNRDCLCAVRGVGRRASTASVDGRELSGLEATALRQPARFGCPA